MIGQNRVCANGNCENPVIRLNDEDLRHEAVEATETFHVGPSN